MPYTSSGLFRNVALWDEKQEIEWLADLQDFATELSAIQVARERIRDRSSSGAYLFRGRG
jgi:hypothetical protein